MVNSNSSSSSSMGSTTTTRSMLVKGTLLIGFVLAVHVLLNDIESIVSLKDATTRRPSLTNADAAAASTLPVATATSPTKSSSSSVDIYTTKAVALPSVRIEPKDSSSAKEVDRKIYGGKGDKVHLGGFTDIDVQGLSPASWKYMVQELGIKSVLDVGCGRGISTSWFALHGVDTMCVEGSHDAVERRMFDGGPMVEHDFSRGPWWPPHTVDAVWCVEFLEHVGRNYMQNYITAFQKAALVFCTHSQWGGWHHVEVHSDDWWIVKMQSYGLVYSEYLTKTIRSTAAKERDSATAPNGEKLNAQHVWLNMQVFINPTVAAMPQHQHLFAEHGCFAQRNVPNRPCQTEKNESPLPQDFLPLPLTDAMDKAWEDLVKQNVQQKEQAT